MSLFLEQGTQPDGLPVKTWAHKSTVHIGEYEISMQDFLATAHYVLTNTDLTPDDPRLKFLKCVQSMKQIDGYNQDNMRLQSSEDPT